MTTESKLEHLTALAEIKFKNLGITDEMYDAVINYLIETGALTYCGSETGCNRSCQEGQECGRHYRGNCLCALKP